jgi:hypothetical protein
MPIFIELVTDAFEETFSSRSAGVAATSRVSSRAGNRVARRPTRGLEIKEDTYASIKVILSDGSELPLLDSSSRDGTSQGGYSNFILQSVGEARMEKHQLVETFGATYIHFFGEAPRFLDVTAVLINSHDFNWEAEWWENYNENFRGTKLVEKGARLYLFYDDNIVEGYMLQCQAQKVSTEPHLIQMSFRMFLTNYRNISFIGSPEFPIHGDAIITDGADVTSNHKGPSFDQSQTDAAPDRGSALTRAISNGSFAQAPRLSELLRDANRQGSVDPTTQAALDRIGARADSQRALPIRTLIADNFDEYVGLAPNAITAGGSPASTGGQPLLAPADRARLETDDLHQTTIDQLGAHGADVSNPTALTDLGMMPNFESDARSPATFTPKEKEAFGFNTGGETTGDDVTNPTASFRQDPLGAIFGGSLSVGRQTDNRFTEGAGDAKYGFRSEFASGPGFGQTGFGDFGGPGFGSGQGSKGDPGFKDPSRFTFSGVSKNKAAFAKFNKPRPDQTTFGKGAGIASSSSGLSGGAAVRVGGKVSAFSLVSVPGVLKL